MDPQVGGGGIALADLDPDGETGVRDGTGHLPPSPSYDTSVVASVALWSVRECYGSAGVVACGKIILNS